MTFCGSVPQPISSRPPPSTPRNGIGRPGQAHQRPLRAPRAEAAEAHRRVDLPAPAVVGLEPADGDEVAQPLDGQARVHPPARGPAPRSSPAWRCEVAVRRRWSSQPGVSSATICVRSCSATSGMPPRRRDPVEVDEVREAVRLGVGQLDHQRPALGVPDDGHRRPGDSDRSRPSRRGCRRPRSTAGVVAVAVAALVPGDDPPSGGGQLRGEDVVGAGEVEAAVDQQAAAGQPRRPIRGRPGRRRSYIGTAGRALGARVVDLEVRRRHGTSVRRGVQAVARTARSISSVNGRGALGGLVWRRSSWSVAVAAGAAPDEASREHAAADRHDDRRSPRCTITTIHPAEVLHRQARRHARQDRQGLPGTVSRSMRSTASPTPTTSRPVRAADPDRRTVVDKLPAPTTVG